MFTSTKVMLFSQFFAIFLKYHQFFFLLHYLTFNKRLIFSTLPKSYKNGLKKNKKKYTSYQKNAYLCTVLMNK